MSSSFGFVSSIFDVTTRDQEFAGTISFKDRSFQFSSSYLYEVPISEVLSLAPALILTYNQNSFVFREKKVVLPRHGTSELSPSFRYLAEKDLNFYFSSGMGLKLSYYVNDHFILCFSSHYHFSIVPNYLWRISGTITEGSIVQQLSPIVVLNTGTRLSNSISFIYTLNSIK